jgi:protease-4
MMRLVDARSFRPDNAPMSDTTNPPVPPPQRRGCGRFLLWGLIVGSLFLNIILCGVLGFRQTADDEDLTQTRLWGDDDAKNKIAVIRIEGVLMEGMTGYALKQIEQAAKDEKVKAIVVRIDSPGGTVSASEELHRLLTQLRDGALRKYPHSKPKKMVVSMGSIAASGGYYIAMPAEKILADPICITGSIGVYASLPNVAEFINQHGIKFELIKAGGIKASGSPFHELTPQERQPWQDMVDSSYEHFLEIVAAGRPNLTKDKLRDEAVVRERIARRDSKGNVIKDWLGRTDQVDYVRYRADGGTFTAAEALKFGLIDEVGTLDKAVDAVAAAAQLSKYQVVAYEKPTTLLNTLFGVQVKTPGAALDPHRLSNGATPRLWYLAPQADLAGILMGMAKE